jgi:hypothetical protein
MKAILFTLTAIIALASVSTAQVPGIINYQGRVAVGGTNFDGTGLFKFALVSGGTNTAKQATATANLTGQFVTSYTVTFGGTNYPFAPTITVTNGGGSGATAVAFINTYGVVTNVSPVAAGSGYTSAPTVTIATPPPNLAYQTYWSNDGSSLNGNQPTAAVPLTVIKGLYAVLLGDTTISNMTLAIPATTFANMDVRLRAWFNDGVNGFQQLSPDQRIAAAGYALVAANAPTGTTTSANDFSLPTTSASSNGVLYIGGEVFLQAFGVLNTFVGGAGNFTMTGTKNTAVGINTLVSDTSGSANTVNGTFALESNTSGSDNTAIGANALAGNTTGSENTACGQGALGNNTTAIGNTAIGYQTLLSETAGVLDTATGFRALFNDTSGSENTADGYQALFSDTTGSGNTANGAQALFSDTTGSDNTANGYQALFNNTNGSFNVANGYQALFNNTNGSFNVAIGYQALDFNTTGSNNTANGYQALFFNKTGSENTANGYQALFGNNTGSNNTANGYQALLNNTSGSENTADGYQALFNNTSGSNNAANGYQALFNNTSGSDNTADGVGALFSNTSGSNNIALGYSAGSNLNGSNNIDIGNIGTNTDSAVIRIGTPGTQTAIYIAGINASVSGSPVSVNFFGQLGIVSSSRRFKQDIRDMGDQSDVLLSLRPVAFHYKHDMDPQGLPQFGLIAEEVEKVAPELVLYDAKGVVYTVRYEQINAMLLNEFQKEHRQIQTLAEQKDSQIAELRQQNSTLENRLEQMEKRLEQISEQVEQTKVAPLQTSNLRGNGGL